MHGMLSYEERIRLQRANGLITEDECTPCTNRCHNNEEDWKGKTYADIAALPQPLRRTCPHTKVIVPVTPAFLVEEKVRKFTPESKDPNWGLVDFNPCDGRNQGLKSIPTGAKVDHYNTVVKADKKVIDTVYDNPFEVTAITTDIEKNGEATQPILTGATTAEPEKVTENDKDLIEAE